MPTDAAATWGSAFFLEFWPYCDTHKMGTSKGSCSSVAANTAILYDLPQSQTQGKEKTFAVFVLLCF